MTSRCSISQSTASYAPAISESKRADVLQAAGKCFLKNGFARTTMDQIARDADVSKLTLYSHFQNKETLFKAMIEAKCRDTCLRAAWYHSPIAIPVQADHWFSMLRGMMQFRMIMNLEQTPSAGELRRHVEHSVEMFLRAYARPSTAPRRWVSAVNRIAALGGLTGQQWPSSGRPRLFLNASRINT